jgi:peptidoglycan/LPS O-acetylase OafA/YrhL
VSLVAAVADCGAGVKDPGYRSGGRLRSIALTWTTAKAVTLRDGARFTRTVWKSPHLDQDNETLLKGTRMKRLLWLDIAKAIAISWVVYFHFFNTVFEHTQFPAADWSSFAAGTVTVIRMAWLKISGIGFHAVGVFIILSGWAPMESTSRRAESASLRWGNWYGSRFLRLYPMYWVAHLVYLVSPFVARLEPVDSRIILSLLGLRFIDITMNFMYLNAAWWYFSMLIQFYVMFPLLFWAARRFGPFAFLLVACALGFFVRYLLLVVYPQHGFWVLGGFAVCRLPEFALGMALGMWHKHSSARIEWFLLRGAGLLAGLLLYPAAMWLYRNGITYVFVDFATGACCLLEIVGVAGIISRFGSVAKVFGLVGAFSYGLYLIHQPYVIWLGLRIRPISVSLFLLVFVATLAVLSAWGILLEKLTNALVNKLFAPKK